MVVGDTIAAIATAPGRGGVAVIRVSGPEAFAIAGTLTKRTEAAGGTRGFGVFKVHAPVTRGSSVIDECLVLFFRAPHSYTGEDVVEFQCHGGTVTTRRVLEACFAAGARLARRGEFTQRAFLNGKLDYDQAESVLDLIDAKTARAADAALEGLAGRKRRESAALYEEALAISTDLEHALDIDEGELPSDFLPSVQARISALRDRMEAAIRREREGKILREGALVVLAGAPNAGKSSLMNALLEENRAIVSDIPGTTRDSIEEGLDIDGWPIRLTDTAGLRETGDVLEREGVTRAEKLMSDADVVVILRPAGAQDCPSADQSTVIAVTSKCDIARGEGLNVSAKTGEGLPELRRAIVAKLEERFADGHACSPSPDETHLAVLLDASSALASSGPSDLILRANAVRTAAEKLGALVGATYSADLLDRLFSRFCIGK